ncbi:type IV pilus modification protein PilV [Cognatazoarcus halotolerans]|uniref:type IV pilus modification protein PilV n=1 Tax=Cognatazoarcus halotolerans TaxID=2686016 RepID=UPI001356C15A|nr:type IV pilus modification protein PilV [Cognatazoarcus halotolerans]MBX3678674.1 type IV pilus modification protein PilV [Rhodocyclaceae bacterium]MCB1899507.1 type IV pilus modification protein PilV [Rhodocyclaceae bacterium]MCP5309445.1 type IV pilus modification protein PilV [Zoogloeaceae bacterium]
MNTKRHSPGLQAGTTLIEVLVAVVVLSIGLLGIAGLQLSALRNTQGAYERSAAVILANSLAERMAADRLQAIAGAYNMAMGAGGCAGPGAGTLAATNLTDWSAEIKQMLGETGCGGVNCAAGLCVVSIRWTDRGGEARSDMATQMSVEVRLQ